GLGRGDDDGGFNDVDYGLYQIGTQLEVYESGSRRAGVGTCATGDRLRVSVDAGVVRYWKNGALLYTSGVTAVSPLVIDTSITSPWGEVPDAVISGVLAPVA